MGICSGGANASVLDDALTSYNEDVRAGTDSTAKNRGLNDHDENDVDILLC